MQEDLKAVVKSFKLKDEEGKKVVSGFANNWPVLNTAIIRPSMERCKTVMNSEGLECEIDEDTSIGTIKMSIFPDKTEIDHRNEWPSITFTKDKPPFVSILKTFIGHTNMTNSVVITKVDQKYVDEELLSFVKANLEKWRPSWN